MDKEIILSTIAFSLKALKPYFEDSSVTEISVNPGGSVWVQKSGVIERVAETVTENDLVLAINAIASNAGQDAQPGTRSSMVTASLSGMRVAGGLMPLSPDGSFLTIRKHLEPSKRPSLTQLLEWGALTQEQARVLTKAFVHDRLNCLVVGATDSGKTTIANALLKLIPKHERVLTIEEVPELSCDAPNIVRLLTDLTGDIRARDLIKHSLVLRPDRIIVGESKGDETYDVIRAFNSGHHGSLTTIHASSAKLGLDMLEMLFQMSLPENASIGIDTVRKYIGGAVNLVIYVDRQYEPLADGGVKSVRKVREILFVNGVKDGEYVLEKNG